MKTLFADSNEMVRVMPAPKGGIRDWQRWAPYAAVTWSVLYGVLRILWAVSGRGFPYTPEYAADPMAPLLGRFAEPVIWTIVILAGFPAAIMGVAMLRGLGGRVARPLFITGGGLLAGVLLLLMVGLDLLVLVGYIPYTIVNLIKGSVYGQRLLDGWNQWSTYHELLCLVGGFLWLAATVVYARRSGEACLYCGRKDGPEGWTGPVKAARWGRIAVYIAMVPPVFYAFTRYAWALGWPLGMTEEYLREGQLTGRWISGLFLASFCLAGALLMLGLIQRWGERFPRWMIGLAGRRVPIALAVIPAALASVLLIVGGVVIAAGTPQMSANLAASGVKGSLLISGLIFQLGPTLIFPVWGAGLAVAALGYYFRRRGPCSVCGRGQIE